MEEQGTDRLYLNRSSGWEQRKKGESPVRKGQEVVMKWTTMVPMAVLQTEQVPGRTRKWIQQDLVLGGEKRGREEGHPEQMLQDDVN